MEDPNFKAMLECKTDSYRDYTLSVQENMAENHPELSKLIASGKLSLGLKSDSFMVAYAVFDMLYRERYDQHNQLFPEDLFTDSDFPNEVLETIRSDRFAEEFGSSPIAAAIATYALLTTDFVELQPNDQ